MRVAVIGGGASGLMCAGFLSLNGNDVDLFESNEKLGKKLFITGKGRCNVTNYCEPNEVLNNVVTNSKFLYSSLPRPPSRQEACPPRFRAAPRVAPRVRPRARPRRGKNRTFLPLFRWRA